MIALALAIPGLGEALAQPVDVGRAPGEVLGVVGGAFGRRPGAAVGALGLAS